AGLVLPRELYDWLSGKERDGNFMTALFGPSGESAFVGSVQNVFKQVENLIAASMEASRKSIEGVRNEFSLLEDVIAPFLEDIAKLLELGAAYQRGGISALVEKNMQIENRELARKQAEDEAAELYSRTGKKTSRAEIRARADEIYSNLESRRLERPEERSWWQRWQ